MDKASLTSEQQTFVEDMKENMDLLRLHILKIPGENRGFVTSLCNYYEDKDTLTPKQLPYAVKWWQFLANKLDPNAPRVASINWDTAQLWELFTKAYASGLKYPQVKFNLPDLRKVTISRWSYGEKPLTVLIDNLAIAFLPKGKEIVWKYNASTNETKLAIKHILDSEDLASKLSILGKQQHSCCFCGKELTTKESIYAGYGPICADHWGGGTSLGRSRTLKG